MTALTEPLPSGKFPAVMCMPTQRPAARTPTPPVPCTPRRRAGERRTRDPQLAAIIDRIHGEGEPLDVFCSGIGGSGVSGIARMLAALGHRVRGSDRTATPLTDELQRSGIRVLLGQKAENVSEEPVDLLIRSAAVPDEHPEVAAAHASDILEVKYARALGLLMEGRRGIAIAGTHGKTTTTAMTALILDRAGLDPSMVVGGTVSAFGGSSRAGRGPHLVAEACEFDRSFLELCPTVSILNNIEADHLDYFAGGLAEITGAFADFLDLLPEGGAAIVNADDRHAMRAARRARAEGVDLVTFGFGERASFRAENVQLVGGLPRFSVRAGDDERPEVAVQLAVPGIHNVRNALAAMAAAWCAGAVPPRVAAEALAGFRGVDRRFQILNESERLVVIDDYAHHPTAVGATIAATRERWPGRRVWAVFQPHQGSRTRVMQAQFADALATADRVTLPEIYFARDSEEERRTTSSADLARAVQERGTSAVFQPSFPGLMRHLLDRTGHGDVVLVMGAGDIWQLAHALAARVRGDSALDAGVLGKEDDGERLVA